MEHKAIKHPLLAIIIVAITFSARTLAEDFRGEVVRYDGCVHIINAAGDRHAVEDTGSPIRESDTIVTAEGSNAIIRFSDGVLSVLNEKSRLRIEKTHWLTHLGGQIYFTFKKVFSGSRQVKTRFATLGIRGTSFIVYDDDSGQHVALQEGVLDVESPGSVFEIYRQQQLDEFEAFKQQTLEQQQEIHRQFDDYRQQLTREYIEFRENFTLQPGRIARFDGDRVDESLFDEEVEEDFENFEAIAGELLEQFREQARQHRESIESPQALDEEDFNE